MANHLRDYVQNGGHLVLGPRSGMKDQYDALLPQRQPGYLADVLGGRVEQYYALEADVPVSGSSVRESRRFGTEQLKATSADTKSLEEYGESNGWLDHQPAVLTHSLERGTITYIGVGADEKTMAAAAEWMTKQSGASHCGVWAGAGWDRSLPARKRWQARFRADQLLRTPQHVALSRSMKALLLGSGDVTSVDLPAYGVESSAGRGPESKRESLQTRALRIVVGGADSLRQVVTRMNRRIAFVAVHLAATGILCSAAARPACAQIARFSGEARIQGFVRGRSDAATAAECPRGDHFSSAVSRRRVASPALDGQFRFSGVGDGQFDIVVNEKGYQPYRERIFLANGNQVQMTVNLKKAAPEPEAKAEALSAHELTVPQKARDT